MVDKQRRFHNTRPAVERRRQGLADIETRVAILLASNGQVDASHIFVTAIDGAIALTGMVLTREEIKRCTDIALSVDGVTAVRNEIRLIPR